jgi:stage V sporulation protein B
LHENPGCEYAFYRAQDKKMPMRGVKRVKIAKGSAAYGALTLTGVNLITQLIGFVYRIFLSRLIGAEGMGLYQLIFPVYSMTMSLTASGLYVAVSRLSAEYLALGSFPAVKKLVRTAVIIFLSLFVPVSVVIAAGSDYISAEILGDVRVQAGLILLIPCILLTGLENIYKNYFYGSKNVRPPAVSETTEQLVRMGAVLSLLYFLRPGHGEAVIALIVIGMTFCEIVSSTMLRLFYKRDILKKCRAVRAADPREGPPEMGGLTAKMAKVALPVMLTSLLGTLLGSATPSLSRAGLRFRG